MTFVPKVIARFTLASLSFFPVWDAAVVVRLLRLPNNDNATSAEETVDGV